jgi:NNP family nitrate/nitrite transporter-like MFS transporter
MGWLMAVPSVITFTAGVLGCAIRLGLGNGGVFKLVPQYFLQQTGTGLGGGCRRAGRFLPAY